MINGIIDTASDAAFSIVAGQYLIVAFVIMIIIDAIIEGIAKAVERKKERERRALKRYNAPIRPAHRR